MTPREPSASVPGAWLVTIARAVFDEPALSHAALPTIADFQQEWIDAGASRRGRWMARWRGYVAFWSLVLMAPIVFRPSAGQSQRSSPRARRIGIGAVAIVAVIAGSANMQELIRVLDAVPGEAWRAIGNIGHVAFLIGPVAIALIILRRRAADTPRFSMHVSTAMLLSMLSVTAAACLGGAQIVGVFSGISQHGSGGVGAIAPGISATALALRNGLLMTLACLAIAGTMSMRAMRGGHGTASAAEPAMSRPLVFGLSVLLAVLLLGVDQLLRTHHEAMRLVHVLIAGLDDALPKIDPARAAGQMPDIANAFERSLGMLLFGGAALTTVVLVAGVVTWRVTRARTSHQFFTWVSRAAIVIAVAGAAYHARVVVTELASFYETVDRLRSSALPSGR